MANQLLEKTEEEIINNSVATATVVMPFDYAEDEHYYFEPVTVKRKIFYSVIKRFFDFFVSFIALALCLVPMIFLAIGVKLSSKGPIFFKQELKNHIL